MFSCMVAACVCVHLPSQYGLVMDVSQCERVVKFIHQRFIVFLPQIVFFFPTQSVWVRVHGFSCKFEANTSPYLTANRRRR